MTWKMEWNVKSVLENLGVPYYAEGQAITFNEICSLGEASERDLSFCYYQGEKALSSIHNSNAGIIICRNDMKGIINPTPGRNQLLIFVENPRFVIIQIINKVYKRKIPPEYQIMHRSLRVQRLALIVTLDTM